MARNLALARFRLNFRNMQQTISRNEKANINSIAITYLGPSSFGKKYGLQIAPKWLTRLTMEVAHARFSFVWFKVLATQL